MSNRFVVTFSKSDCTALSGTRFELHIDVNESREYDYFDMYVKDFLVRIPVVNEIYSLCSSTLKYVNSDNLQSSRLAMLHSTFPVFQQPDNNGYRIYGKLNASHIFWIGLYGNTNSAVDWTASLVFIGGKYH